MALWCDWVLDTCEKGFLEGLTYTGFTRVVQEFKGDYCNCNYRAVMYNYIRVIIMETRTW